MTALLIAIIALSLIFDFINGFHDAANSIATIVSTKVLTPFQAVLWAAMFNFIAFFIFKDHGVADTISKIAKHATLAVVLSGIVAAVIWNLLTWWYGIPSSSSHTLIGGFAGAAIANGGMDAVNAEPVIKTVAFIVLAPVIGMVIAFIISLWFVNAYRKSIIPKLISLGIIAIVIVFLIFHLETDPAKLKTHYDSYFLKVLFYSGNFKWILMGLIVVAMSIFTLFLSSLNVAKSQLWFKRMQLVSSAAFSIGHGGNDAQKVMGIITVAIVINQGIDPMSVTDINSVMPWWVPIACYTAIAAGTMSGGWKIIKTMGTRITKVTPFEGVAAETAGAITLFVTEQLKIPVSTTHTITGSIIGVGATKRLSAVRWGVTINLLWAWILTIPVSALMAAGIYYITTLF
ncbi:MAG TPA: inorganic phosphate transporter [Flavipsychrobacter sp.]|jgi:PiT family inorganic phosphate transporter|nr:inorganic phosphate transporter [Flavipsychrobacter sp.]